MVKVNCVVQKLIEEIERKRTFNGLGLTTCFILFLQAWN